MTQAIGIEKSGKQVELKKTEDFEVPEELQQQFDAMPELKEAFDQLTTWNTASILASILVRPNVQI